MDKNFYRPVPPKFEAPWVEGLPYMLETCREGPRPIRLCVEKTKNLTKFNHSGPGCKNGAKFDRPVSNKFEAPWVGLRPTCLKLAGKALGLLGCVLKRLKMLTKFNHRGPGCKNGPKFWSACFPQIWSPLSRGSAIYAWNLHGRP